MLLKLFPHSWLEIESEGTRIYVDPSYIASFFTDQAGKVDSLPEPMEKADLILITHGDFDHLNPETIERLRDERTRVLAPLPCARSLGSFASPVAEGEKLTAAGVGIEVVPAYNTPEGRSTNKHHSRGESVGYVLNIGGRRIYHAGDTDLIPEMSELGKVDIAFLPIGGTFTMDIDEAVEAALLIEPALAIPMHTRQQADPSERAADRRADRASRAPRRAGRSGQKWRRVWLGDPPAGERAAAQRLLRRRAPWLSICDRPTPLRSETT
jgi:L-ascorbate metabolism protein UlaG (beta-lactamase superfamily)